MVRRGVSFRLCLCLNLRECVCVFFFLAFTTTNVAPRRRQVEQLTERLRDLAANRERHDHKNDPCDAPRYNIHTQRELDFT